MLDEHLRRIPLLDARLDGHRRALAEFLFDPLEQVLGGALARIRYVPFRHADAARRRQQRVLPHVQYDQVGLVIRSFGSSPGQRLTTAGGSVDANHDDLPFSHGGLPSRYRRTVAAGPYWARQLPHPRGSEGGSNACDVAIAPPEGHEARPKAITPLQPPSHVELRIAAGLEHRRPPRCEPCLRHGGIPSPASRGEDLAHDV